MSASFFFYDLETSGFSPRQARIMQFAGQRTDLAMNAIGEPVNRLIKLTPDVLPDPDAVLVTGITPQATLNDGNTEAEFLKFFSRDICVPDTIFLGYNSVRFDDEFMRFLLWRNFYDAYEWQWCDGCSRWDLLDVVRMTRALRPDGIQWPFNPDGSPSNRLEFLTNVNKLDHANAHDALSDVNATIAVAKLIHDKQPKLFQYLLNMRDKKKVAALVENGQPFVYTSGSYPSETGKTTVAMMIGKPAKNSGAIVYDLRHDPVELEKLSNKELVSRLSWHPRGDGTPRLPAKVIRFNRCPAVAPMSVLDTASRERLRLDLGKVEANRQKLANMPELRESIQAAFDRVEQDFSQSQLVGDELSVDGQLYDGFIPDADRKQLPRVRASKPEDLTAFHFQDTRLAALLPLYKARNFSATLDGSERQAWEQFVSQRLISGGDKSRLAQYFARLQALASDPGLTKNQKYLLEELRLYGEGAMPSEGAA